MSFSSNFAPQSYFFTDPASITQSESEAFGPVNAERFNLTCAFSSSGAMAYSICKGVALLQPQAGNTDAVNLILRPFGQPITGLNIKYFVYRGLAKADFISGETVLADGDSASDFVKKINKSFRDFYASTAPDSDVPPFLARYIGFDPALQPDSLPLDQLFFKQSEYVESNGEFVEKEEEAFELPMIGAGSSLGHFITGECGIDIVLSYGDYSLPTPHDQFTFDLAYARDKKAVITLAEEDSDIQKRHKREQIFQFLDAAAYYGFHSDNGEVTLKKGDGNEKKKGEAIYTDIVSKFHTRNNLYLYIQSNRGRSYDYYGNYGDLKVGPTQESLDNKAYQNDGWPLMIDKAPQAHDEVANTLCLQLSTDNGQDTMLYGQVAEIASAKNNFMDAAGLRQPTADDGTTSDYTSTITLSNPAVGEGGAKLNIANFNTLVYQGRANPYQTGTATDSNGQVTPTYGIPNFFDDVFDQVTAEPLLKASEASDFGILSAQRLKLINHYYNKKQYGITAVQSLNINDAIDTDETGATLKRVTYVTEAVDVLNSAFSLSGTITADTKTRPSVSGAVGGSNTYQLPEPYYYSLQPFTDGTETIRGPILKVSDGTIPAKIVLGLTKAENDRLRDLISTDKVTNARLFLVDLFGDGNELISPENITYQKYRAGIVGEDGDGVLRLYTPEEDVMVYSLDRKYHFSKGYSEYMPNIEQEYKEFLISKVER
ncbi:hypothetical protein [Pedobacter endophyticus]|uniref:Uncharacterized protein n=1 Tax=Pedobacter endophyticus TaxID=2789740 RepID=A0A7S9Q0C7_9SPHI|nr:hypothetical protein [Pedobacter endophyticus]QPH40850.1 hypothetical protein IZT61_06175 [Pedobacter endophyticus]